MEASKAQNGEETAKRSGRPGDLLGNLVSEIDDSWRLHIRQLRKVQNSRPDLADGLDDTRQDRPKGSKSQRAKEKRAGKKNLLCLHPRNRDGDRGMGPAHPADGEGKRPAVVRSFAGEIPLLVRRLIKYVVSTLQDFTAPTGLSGRSSSDPISVPPERADEDWGAAAYGRACLPTTTKEGSERRLLGCVT
jgi:hypothetical protein